MSESRVTVQLRHRQDYQFDTDFGPGIPAVLADEPPPLGQGQGPSPMHLLCAAVGNCLAASLRFACAKFKQSPDPIRCEVTAETGRNADRRMRVLAMSARLDLGVPAESIEHLDRILGSFEDFCTVTASVRAAIPVTVTVVDSTGVTLTASPALA